jgi:hypothetical protein
MEMSEKKAQKINIEEPVANNTEATPPPNEMALENLRLNQNFVETAGVKRLLTTVPVRKPGPQDFIRVHSDPAFRATVALLELKEDREVYLLKPAMAQELPGEFFMATLYTVINRQNVVSLWPVRLPAPDGRQLDWHRSAAQAAELAQTKWIRIRANMGLRAYEIDVAGVTHSDPIWPADITLQNLIEIAFKERFINRIDHPVVQRLRGLS